jgi:hypothetical protein
MVRNRPTILTITTKRTTLLLTSKHRTWKRPRYIAMEIAFIRYAQSRHVRKQIFLKKIYGARKPKVLNMIAKIGRCYLCMSERGQPCLK